MSENMMNKISAGSIIVTKDKCRYLVVTSEVKDSVRMGPFLNYKLINIGSWTLSEPSFSCPSRLIEWISTKHKSSIVSVIPENELLPAIPWSHNNDYVTEQGPFVVVSEVDEKYEFLCNSIGDFTNNFEDALLFYTKEEVPLNRAGESIRRFADFLPIRKVSIQSNNYCFNFETNADEAVLESIMEYLTCKVIGYSDDDIVPELQQRGYYAKVISEILIKPDQILSSDW
ncbi:hypothetical protein ABER99_20315 [Paenibacillus glucanolyticus]|jgi:hypothetical protein|uniref:Uncharacterized protein n=1 Tax=Paenibacillus glucanolyticus TaxID=59843 RepID=A0A163GJ65_9BACL|nr:hypothetical protein [Paenibacillus glucanolyticus]KZS45003.1 hypothetical protein AWU65_03210 [Paenibacillus glucanolyticus]OMF64140.1 hypothetical protein BK142_32120 [Paenibacillus glucanolyticus]